MYLVSYCFIHTGHQIPPFWTNAWGCIPIEVNMIKLSLGVRILPRVKKFWRGRSNSNLETGPGRGSASCQIWDCWDMWRGPGLLHAVQEEWSWFICWWICTCDACWEERAGKPLHKLFPLPGTSFLGIIHLSRSRLNVTPSVEPSSSKIWFCLHWAHTLRLAGTSWFLSLHHSSVSLGGESVYLCAFFTERKIL